MRRKVTAIALTALCMTLTGCSGVSAQAKAPLMGLEWFTGYDEVKQALDHTLLDERENAEQKVPQKMLDYTGVSLFDYECDLTLCFTDSGLIGLNYHDIGKNQNYKEWYSTLEKTYGLPTEEGSGMASWYDNPLGKDTAVYLFNLEEGVQISIYATADSPDKSYERPDAVYIPTPELRTPVVPVSDAPTTSAPTASEMSAETAETGADTHALREGREWQYTDENGVLMTDVIMTDADGEPMTDAAGNAVTTAIPVSTQETTASTTAEASETAKAVQSEPPTENRAQSFLQDGLQFYGSPDSERGKMSRFTQLYEYRTEEPGQPWELIMEYENVPYLGKNCDGVLCFTSLGLVGVNYFDANTGDYRFWVQELTDIYGAPDETQYDYSAWSASPVGDGTMIYVFALEDGVQISFFADDAGSELA